jgi:hypothetical protein
MARSGPVSGTTARQRWRDAIRESDDPGIDVYAIAAAFALDTYMSADGRTYTGVRRLAEICRTDKKVMARRVQHLIELGWLTREWAGRGHKAYHHRSVPSGGTL